MFESPRPRSPRSPILSSYNDKFPYPNSASSSSGSRSRKKSGLKSRATQILAIRFGLVVLVIWYEVGEFFHSLSSCRFPDAALLPKGNKGKGKAPSSATPSHLVLLADPHVPHPRLSYPADSRPWVNALRQGMDELFMRKSWNVVMRLGRVDGVVVLGDMLDWGRGDMTDQDYDEYHSLYRSIFRLPPSVPMHFVPGNHDLPLGPNGSPLARDRYAKYFSTPNSVLPIANHSLILLDAVGLVEEDYRRYAAETQFGEWDGVAGGVIEFVKGLGDDPPPGPKILISHIPLARPEASTCGPLRERGRILKGAGPGYQNLLGSETTRFLLDVIRPSVVFSGDDHDYCEHRHPQGVREITLKSFSSSTGIRRPGFQLLSLISPSDALSPSLTHADRPCFLPDQLGVYTRVYLPIAILTFLYLFGTNIRSAWTRWNAAGHSIYADLKARMSPHIGSSETMPTAPSISRRVSERPVPLTLPSRKSSQHLNGNGGYSNMPTPRSARTSHFPTGTGTGRTPSHDQLASSFWNNSSIRSAPASPTGSPRLSWSDAHHQQQNPPPYRSRERERDEDLEADSSSVYDGASPSISRRSSYIYMNGSHTSGNGRESTPAQRSVTAPAPSGPIHSEPSSYFLPIPGTASTPGGQSQGLGISTPYTSSSPGYPVVRRSSSNLSMTNQYTSSASPYQQPRRVTAPRLLSTADWTSAAKAKDKSVLGLLADSLPLTGSSSKGPGGKRRGGLGMIKGFMGWLWRSRNGVVAKSWRECLAVAWPAAVVWVLVNALFFWS